MFKGYIYRHWIVNDKGEEKSYIGQTIQKPEKRWDNGKGYTYNRHTKKHDKNTRFSNAIQKYGWDNFNHEVIGVVESYSENELGWALNEWEVYYIEKYNSYYNGYNETLGGASLHTKELREKRGKSMKGKLAGEKNPMYGVHRYGEDSPYYGHKHSEESKRKISEARKGKKSPMRGKNLSEEQKRKISESRKKYYTTHNHHNSKKTVCIETQEIFNSASEAGRKKGIDNSSISKCCKGFMQNAGGYTWMYFKDYILQLNKNNEDLVMNVA